MMMMMMNFIPPGAKHLKGNALFMSQNLRPTLVGLKQTKLPSSLSFTIEVKPSTCISLTFEGSWLLLGGCS